MGQAGFITNLRVDFTQHAPAPAIAVIKGIGRQIEGAKLNLNLSGDGDIKWRGKQNR